jgi:hypothetical protein
MATGHKPTNQQNHKANRCIAIVQGHTNKTAGIFYRFVNVKSYFKAVGLELSFTAF